MNQEMAYIQQAYDRFIEGDDKHLSQLLFECGSIDKQTSLSIYKNNYLASLFESLSDTYEACRVLLGPCFEKLGYDYISRYKSLDPLLSSYGGEFSNFLKTSLIHKEIPFLSELARYEWNLKRVILEDSKYFFSNYPVSEIWSILVEGKERKWPKKHQFRYLIVKVKNGCKTQVIS